MLHLANIASQGLISQFKQAFGGFDTAVSSDTLKKVWADYLIANNGTRNCFYVHVPFCNNICFFCDCSTAKLDNINQVEKYTRYLFNEMEYYYDTFKNTEFKDFYMGGGTPNLLGTDGTEKVLGKIFAQYSFAKDAVKCVELDPRLVDEHQVERLVQCSINRVSYGVQSLNADTLKQINRRGQPREMVGSCLASALVHKELEVNVDIIFGLAGESVESFLDGVKFVLEFEPTTICIQLIRNSEYAKAFKSKDHEHEVIGEYMRMAAELENLLSKYPKFELNLLPDTIVLVNSGFEVDWRNRQNDPFTKNYETILGLGRFSQSHMYGVMRYQNMDRTFHFDPASESLSFKRLSNLKEYFEALVSGLVISGKFNNADYSPGLGEKEQEQVNSIFSRLGSQFNIRHDGAGHYYTDGLLDTDISAITDELLRINVAVPPKREKVEKYLVLKYQGDEWQVYVEKVRDGMSYFMVVDGCGVYYRNINKASNERVIGDVLSRALESPQHKKTMESPLELLKELELRFRTILASYKGVSIQNKKNVLSTKRKTLRTMG